MTPQHEGVIALSTKKPASADEPAPGPVNTHPGPDFSILQRVRDGLAALPAKSSTEGNEAA